MRRKRLKVALIYNADTGSMPERPEDRGSVADLRVMIRQMARALRAHNHDVLVLALNQDMFAFQRQLRRFNPDIVFNQYEDVVHGALYEMRVAAIVRMMGYPLTGSPALALGLSRYKYMTASLLQGANVRVPPQTRLLEKIGDVNRTAWVFPLIMQPAQEHAGVGLDRTSVVHTKGALREKTRQILTEFHQPALIQQFLPGREFNIGMLGGRRMRVMPLAEVDYSKLPEHIPPIMSYAAKFIENSEEYRKTRVTCPAVIESELAREITTTALRAVRAIGAWGYARVDIRLDQDGRPCVLDVNCNPSLEPEVALARSAETAGIAYPDMLNMIINAALEQQPYDAYVPMQGAFASPALARTAAAKVRS